MIYYLILWCSELDESLQAAIIGAAATVIGGMLAIFAAILASVIAPVIALWGSLRTVRQQLAQDRNERAKDRELQARRDALIDGVGGMAEAAQAVSMIVQTGADAVEVQLSFQRAMGKITRAATVASPASIRAAQEFVEAVGPAFSAAAVAKNVAGFEAGSASIAIMKIQKHRLLRKLHLAIEAARKDIGIEDAEGEFISAVTTNWNAAADNMKEFMALLGLDPSGADIIRKV